MAKILICKCVRAGVLDGDGLRGVIDSLQKAGIEFDTADDLCAMARNGSDELAAYADDDTIIFACHNRAIHWLFDYAGAKLSPKAKIINLRDGLPADFAEILAELQNNPPMGPARHYAIADDDALAWFPVIDYNRCINCGQCLNFCLFGVYTRSEDKIKVANPDKCKPNCPACARVCPAKAIIFAKYDKPPFEGTEIIDEPQTEKLSAVDIFSQLKQRNANNLQAMQKELDIPDTVIKDINSKTDK